MPEWSQQIEEDLDWREAELASLKMEASRCLPGSPKQIALLRALWALLYAHYEGFFKFVWGLYLDSLQQLGVARIDCQEAIAKLSLEKPFARLRGDLSHDAIWQFCAFTFGNLLQGRLDFHHEQISLKMECNLWPQTLCSYCDQVGLSHLTVDQHSVKLRALVQRRNDIAHGKKMIIQSLKEYQEYEDAAFLVMCELAVSVVESLDKKTYLK